MNKNDLEKALKASKEGTIADLRSADLSFADLSSANLSFADLSSADLRSAKLIKTKISIGFLNYFEITVKKGEWTFKKV